MAGTEHPQTIMETNDFLYMVTLIQSAKVRYSNVLTHESGTVVIMWDMPAMLGSGEIS